MLYCYFLLVTFFLCATAFSFYQVLAKNARFEQIWRSRKGVKDAKDDQLHDMYHIYDIVRLDTNKISSEVPEQE